MTKHKKEIPILGWREVVSLRELGIPKIRAKVDTGAKTSSIDAVECEVFEDALGVEMVRFVVRVGKRNYDCECPVYEHRSVRSSSGHEAIRPVIVTTCQALGIKWPIELTLADREQMRYSMLLGREALSERFVVDPGMSYLGGKHPSHNKPKR